MECVRASPSRHNHFQGDAQAGLRRHPRAARACRRSVRAGPHPDRQQLRLVVLCAALSLSASRPAISSCPLAAVVGGCSGRVLAGQGVGGCPFGVGPWTARESLEVAVAGEIAHVDVFCPCERIRIAKLLVLSASGGGVGSSMAGKIQFCVGALCVVDFCCGIPAVRCLLVRGALAMKKVPVRRRQMLET